MTIELAHNTYGESRIRLLRLMHRGGLHEVKDLTLDVRFEGDFDASHRQGENRAILPAETIKNTVYVLSRQYPAEAIEEFAFHLTEHFLTYNPQVTLVDVRISERPWSRITIGEKGHASAFVANASEKRTSHISARREKIILHSGIDDLQLMKTAGFSFGGFLRDPYTTLQENQQRILRASLTANWSYALPEPEMPFSTIWHGVRKTVLETFAAHEGKSLQHTLYALAQAVLENFEAMSEIQLRILDNYCPTVDLKSFGMENDNELFVPLEESQGAASLVLRRSELV
jgi:urate oxidase